LKSPSGHLQLSLESEMPVGAGCRSGIESARKGWRAERHAALVVIQPIDEVVERTHLDTRHDLLAEGGEGIAGLGVVHQGLDAGARVHQQCVVVALGCDSVFCSIDGHESGVSVDSDSDSHDLHLDGVGCAVAASGVDHMAGVDLQGHDDDFLPMDTMSPS
jgi:hypothetical protein